MGKTPAAAILIRIMFGITILFSLIGIRQNKEIGTTDLAALMTRGIFAVHYLTVVVAMVGLTLTARFRRD